MQNVTDEQLRDYLLQRLAPADRENIEVRLEKDSKLQERLATLRDLQLIADLSRHDETRALLQQMREEDRVKRKRWWWGGGLFVLLVCALATWWGSHPDPALRTPRQQPIEHQGSPLQTFPPDQEQETSPPTEQELQTAPAEQGDQEEQEKSIPNKAPEPPASPPVFAALITDVAVAAHQLPPSPSDRGGLQNNITKAYEQLTTPGQDAKIILDRLLALEAQNPDNQELQRSIAHAYFYTGDYDQCTTYFATIVKRASGADKDLYEWYWLLALLARDNEESSQTDALFDKMLDPNAFHNMETPARRLKVRLDEIENSRT